MFIRITLIAALLFPLFFSGCSSSSNDPDSATQSTISLSVIGPGSIVSNDGSLDCDSTCSATYTIASTVNLTAVPDADSRFVGWSWFGCQPMDQRDCDVAVGPGKNNVQLNAEFESTAVKVYDITFEEPIHTANEPPKFGATEEYVSEYYDISDQFTPTVVDGHGALTSQVLLFQPRLNVPGTLIARDDMSLFLKHGADSYKIEFDLVVTEVAPASPLLIRVDWPRENRLEFDSSGNILFNGASIGTYVAGEKLHVVADISVVNKQVAFNINGTATGAQSLDGLSVDIDNIRMELGGEETSRAAIDNIHILARLNESLPVPEPDGEGKHVMDFELPVITSPSGGSSNALPYSQDGFNLTSVARIDPVIHGGNPTNGSIYSRFALFSRPILYHQYGYGFQLLSIDVAQYSDVSGPLTRDIEVIGIKKSGQMINTFVDKAMFGMFFNTINFDASWSDLKYVVINDDVYSLDNIVVKLNDQSIGYPAP